MLSSLKAVFGAIPGELKILQNHSKKAFEEIGRQYTADI